METIEAFDWEPADIYDINGTCLRGKFFGSYETLVWTFGAPTHVFPAGESSQVAWDIKFTSPDGDRVIASIYDWKQGVDVREVKEWNIGGHSYAAVECVDRAVREMSFSKG